MLWYLSLHFPIPGLERLCSLADGTMWVARRWFPPSQGRAQNQLILSVGTCQISISEHAQCVPENQTAPASPTRLALSHSLTPVWGFLSFPERNLSLISVFLSLSWLPQLYLSKDPGRTKKFSSFLLFQYLLWRDLWKREFETCLLQHWLFQHTSLRECAADFRQMMFFPWLHHYLFSSSYSLLCPKICDHWQKVCSSGCVSGYLETDPLASQDEVTCQHNLPIPARPRDVTETI